MKVHVGDYFIYTYDQVFRYKVTQCDNKGGVWLSEIHNGRLTPVGYGSDRPDWTADTIARVLSGGTPRWRYEPRNPHITLPVGA